MRKFLKKIAEKIRQTDQSIASWNVDSEAMIHENGHIVSLGTSDKLSKHLTPYLAPFFCEQSAHLACEHGFRPARLTYEVGVDQQSIKITFLDQPGYERVKHQTNGDAGLAALTPKLVAFLLHHSHYNPWLESVGLSSRMVEIYQEKTPLSYHDAAFMIHHAAQLWQTSHHNEAHRDSHDIHAHHHDQVLHVLSIEEVMNPIHSNDALHHMPYYASPPDALNDDALCEQSSAHLENAYIATPSEQSSAHLENAYTATPSEQSGEYLEEYIAI